MLTVAELAGRTGVAPSTVRFYERQGLLTLAGRGTNGYRLFGEDAVSELLFIGRAKGIGMQLEEIAEMRQAWAGGECRVLQARLRSFLAERIANTRSRREDLLVFERQLEAVLGRLTARDPDPEACGNGCDCEADLEPADKSASTSDRIGRTLEVDANVIPIHRRQPLATTATVVENKPGQVRLAFPCRSDVLERLVTVRTQGNERWGRGTFEISSRGDAFVLTISADNADELAESLIAGTPDEHCDERQ